MRAVRYHEFGEPDVLQVDEIEPLTPLGDEVLVDVRATGVNPCDVLRREGLWGDDLPLIAGSDVAGVVAAVGSDDGPFDVGDRVFGTVPMLTVGGDRSDRQGVCAERVVVRTERLARLPDNVAFDVGAGMPIVGCTALRALFHHASLQPGQTCLIHGGSGGVGHVAVQIAAATNAHVVATAGDGDKRDVVADLGADVVLDYRRDDLEDAVRDAAPGGYDVIVDHRFEDYVQLDIDVAAKDGIVVVLGHNRDQPRIEDLTVAMGKELTIQPQDMFNTVNIDDYLRRLAVLMASEQLTLSVARTYDFEDAHEAHRAVMEDSFVGKLVITP